MSLLINLLFLLNSLFGINTPNWSNDVNKAFTEAKSEHKYILLNFSGSDWCGPCIRLHKDIFATETFSTMASSTLILINADFPRSKKNQLSVERQKTNDQLADKYNPKGNFPLTLLLNENAEIVKSWEGYPKDPNAFIQEIQQLAAQHP